MVKRNKRKQAVFGIDDAIMLGIGLLSTAVSAGTSIYNTNQQTAAAQKSLNAQKAAAIRNSNAERTSMLQSNLYGLANNQQEEKSRVIPTQESAFKLGGRKCKKNGGRLTKFI